MKEEQKMKCWVRKISERALRTLNLQLTLNIQLEEMGERFKTLENACAFKYNNNTIYVNSDWLKEERKISDETERRFIIYHEVRHFYQCSQIEKYKNAKQTYEKEEIIRQWESEYNNYQQNIGGESTILYYMQDIEIDAYAFGVVQLNIDCDSGDELSMNTRSIPEDIHQKVEDRVCQIKKDLGYKLY